MITTETLSRAGRVSHGFFTREGGVSGGVYASLNCGLGSGDNPEHIAANRHRAMARLDLEGGDLMTVYQTHSADVVRVDEPWTADAAPRADATVTRMPGVALGVLSADCAPVLMADEEAGVIGAVHAGWRGALKGVLEASVEAMCGLGARPQRIVAAVGPAIQQESYEVGPEFHAEFMSKDKRNGAFFRDSPRDGHFMFDLPGYVVGRLEALGLAAVEAAPDDTFGDEERFFSYRRATQRRDHDYGRGLAAIALKQ